MQKAEALTKRSSVRAEESKQLRMCAPAHGY